MFPHMVKIQRPRTDAPVIGSQRSDGKFIFSSDVDPLERFNVILDGWGDVQDILKKDDRTPEGSPERMANAVIFLEIEDSIDYVLTDDMVEITYSTGKVEQAVVVEVRRLDGSLLIQRIRETS